MAVNREAVPWSLILGSCQDVAKKELIKSKIEKIVLSLHILLRLVEDRYNVCRYEVPLGSVSFAHLARPICRELHKDWGIDARSIILQALFETKHAQYYYDSTIEKHSGCDELSHHKARLLWYMMGLLIRLQYHQSMPCNVMQRRNPEPVLDTVYGIPQEWIDALKEQYNGSNHHHDQSSQQNEELLGRFWFERTIYMGFRDEYICSMYDMPDPIDIPTRINRKGHNIICHHRFDAI